MTKAAQSGEFDVTRAMLRAVWRAKQRGPQLGEPATRRGAARDQVDHIESRSPPDHFEWKGPQSEGSRPMADGTP